MDAEFVGGVSAETPFHTPPRRTVGVQSRRSNDSGRRDATDRHPQAATRSAKAEFMKRRCRGRRSPLWAMAGKELRWTQEIGFEALHARKTSHRPHQSIPGRPTLADAPLADLYSSSYHSVSLIRHIGHAVPSAEVECFSQSRRARGTTPSPDGRTSRIHSSGQSPGKMPCAGGTADRGRAQPTHGSLAKVDSAHTSQGHRSGHTCKARS